jgi:hypothetical protein
MSDNNNPDSLQRVINYQRRSVSAGDTRFRTPADDRSEICNDEQTTDANQYITQCTENGYHCTPLPRTNHRPTAKTCWLVIMFSSLYNIFPYDKINF